MNKTEGNKMEWSRQDDNCSKACTRSGIAVLLVSAFALSILPLLGKMEPLNALLGYINRRITLKEELSRLQSDPVWKRLKAFDESAVTWNLYRLLAYSEDADSVSPEQRGSKFSVELKWDVKEKGTNGPPSVTDLKARLLGQIAPIPAIVKTLVELTEDDLLNLARKYSYRYDVSIFRWALLLYSLKIADEKDVLNLALAQIEEISNFDLPEISEAERLQKDASFTFPSLGVPQGITSGTFFIEISLLLLTCYFWVWYREARLSPNFPAAGTLFGALARSASSRLMFYLLILLPPIAAALVAMRTLWLTYLNVFFAVLTTAVTYLIARQGEVSGRAASSSQPDLSGTDKSTDNSG